MLLHHLDSVIITEEVAFPFAGHVAVVAALDKDWEDVFVRDGGFRAVLVEVVELTMDVDDLRHDLEPHAWLLATEQSKKDETFGDIDFTETGGTALFGEDLDLARVKVVHIVGLKPRSSARVL